MSTGTGDSNGDGKASDPERIEAPSAEVLVPFWYLPLAMMGVRNFDGYFTLVNPAYQELLGWSPDELMSVPYWEFVHPDDRHGLVEFDQQLMEGASSSRTGYEVRMLCRDGRYRWTRWYTGAIQHEQLFYTIAGGLNGSRKDDERADVGSWEWHICTDGFTVAETLYGLFTGPDGPPSRYRAFLAWVHPAHRRRVDRELRASLVAAQPYSDDFDIQRPDGSVRRLHVAGRPIPGPDGEPGRVCGIAVDVTDRRRRRPDASDPR